MSPELSQFAEVLPDDEDDPSASLRAGYDDESQAGQTP